ncbi:hypothetical protein EUGRSUZ_E04118 [Eucalyptus grandis]|uniref:Uncharacterized protein n=2 Tax=Eucalyptus grandis TaxID=71139 RepID=A0ACC3L113_EUCGR|nr:hypothetical protein EUGRSUZ_E04118 [Eucalyptus grandis]
MPMLSHAAPPKSSLRSSATAAGAALMSPGSIPYDLRLFEFEPIKEFIMSHEMTCRSMMDMITYSETDVIVVGVSSAGFSYAYELSKNPSIRAAIIKQSVSPGGGAWLGGQLFSAMLSENRLTYSYAAIRYVALFTSTIMSKLLARPNVKLFNTVGTEDLIMKGGRVARSCMDPNVMEAKVVVSSCGHDKRFGATRVKRLKSIRMIEEVPGMKALDMNTAEDAIVRLTREIVPVG